MTAMEARPCADCQRTKGLGQAQELEKELNLIPLQGSSKQVEWATKIADRCAPGGRGRNCPAARPGPRQPRGQGHGR